MDTLGRDAMAMQYDIESHPTYLRAACSGSYAYEDVRRVYEDAIATASARDVPKILIDMREVVGDIPTMERFNLGSYLAELCLEHQKSARFRIAVIGKAPLIGPERFGENVARNRGVLGLATTNLDEVREFLELDADD